MGLDSSEAMLEKAAAHAADGVRFERREIETFAAPAAYDLVFSNAALHWVRGHEQLFPRLRAALAPGGQLAVQVPANFDHPSHRIAGEIAAEPPFADALAGIAAAVPVLDPEEYATLAPPHRLRGAARPPAGVLHLLESRSSVVEWVKGTLLTDYQSRLSPELFASFLARYRDRLEAELSDDRPYPYAFKRILMWATL